MRVIQGSDANAGEIAVVCGANCEAAEWALKKLGPAIAAKQIPQPARTIRIVTAEAAAAEHESCHLHRPIVGPDAASRSRSLVGVFDHR